MFSINSRWFMANNTGLLKARGHRKGQNRFWPLAAGQKRQKLAGCGSLPLSHCSVVHTVLYTCPPNKTVQDPPLTLCSTWE